ncbi:hypothetical protein [Tenacibaculum agarivorans]|uniref:hypothetical protein n=1 Tax=Tenacibaculum agarivorans TaxID=1908389 RepID=UPI00094BA791|nr:hypothetical protein [Tenacibaculum agarivorans]
MEKSIEKIWNEAFIDEQSLIAPKINNLYNQKSKSVIHKIKRTYEFDNKGLIPIAILVVIGAAIFSEYFIGLYGAFLILSLYYFNTRLLKKFTLIDIKSDNLTYLKRYREVMNSVMKATKRMFIFILPLAVLSIFILAFNSKETSFLSTYINPDTSFIEILGIGFITAIITSIICFFSYMISTKMLYKPLIDKLDAIINEMETLQQ